MTAREEELRPRLDSIKARNCSSVRASDGSRSKRSQRASSSFFSATLTGSSLSLRRSAGFMKRVSNPAAQIQGRFPAQARRACVTQPRVRRTLGFESAHASVSPNPNGVPSKDERSLTFTVPSTSRGMDATPLGLVVGIAGGSSRYPGLFQPWAIIRKPVGLGAQDQITAAPSSTDSGASTLTCGNRLKSPPLNVSRCSTPWADMTAAMRASCVFFPFTSWVETRLRHSGSTAWRSPSMPNREVRASISISVRDVVHSKPLFLIMRVATAQNSTNTCGVSLMRCPSEIKRCTALVAISWPPELASANRRQMLVSRRMRAMALISPRKCPHGSPPSRTAPGHLGDSAPSSKSQPLAQPLTRLSTGHLLLLPPAHPRAHQRPRKPGAARSLSPRLAAAGRAAGAAATPSFRSIRSLCS